jgi:hypothetical protein
LGYGVTEESSPCDHMVGGHDGSSRSGLVLLYAPAFTELQPAYVFDAPEVIIGRDAHNPICVPEPAVSRRHACIASRHPGWVLNDFGSRNGTIVDGAFVGEVELENLGEIRVGDAIFKFVQDSADCYVRYRLDGKVAGERLAKSVQGLAGGWQMDRVAAAIERIALSPLSCIISGETGTGKKIVAHELHRASGRGGSFQAVNCAAIPPVLFEGEIFGYRRGAFPGADRDRPGLLEQSDGGTLLLDEIGVMPLEAQAKLLRVLQEHRVFPLGATHPVHVDVRVLGGTQRDLYRNVCEGTFREDLFARLTDHTVKLPPLRERKEDTFQLARAFGAKFGKPKLAFTLSFMVALLHYDWPFNVSELESCIARGVTLAGEGQPLDTPHLPDAIFECMASYGQRSGIGSSSVARLPHSSPPKSSTRPQKSQG